MHTKIKVSLLDNSPKENALTGGRLLLPDLTFGINLLISIHRKS